MMRRFGVLLVVLVIAVAGIVTIVRDQDDSYRVEAVFDTARGMVAGQSVKIAGAKVGTVHEVRLVGRKALIRMRIEPRFGPFHDDARCEILPEGFISENFVQCSPGTPGRPALGAGDDAAPRVPLARTSVPVQLQQVIDTFSLPVSERIRVILTEMGMSVAGRGTDINALLRRANPALARTRQVMAIAADQREQVRSAITDTRAVLGRVRAQDRATRAFVDNAGRTVEATAKHRDGLKRSVRSLPPLLTEVDASLATVDRTSRLLAPTARNLRAAAPDLASLTTSMPRFSSAGSPAVRALGRAASAGRPATRSALPVLNALTGLSSVVGRPMLLGRQLFENLRDVGGFENILDLSYGLSTVGAFYDEISHEIALDMSVVPKCLLLASAPGCVHAYRGPDGGHVKINDPDAPSDGPTGVPQRSEDRRNGAEIAPGAAARATKDGGAR